MAKKTLIVKNDTDLLGDLSKLIEQSRVQAAVLLNSTLTLLFWQVGKRINEHILQNKRAEYGKRIVPTLSAQLEKVYGRNFTGKNIRRMMKFAGLFANIEILVQLSRELSWSHFIELFPLKNEEARLFLCTANIC